MYSWNGIAEKALSAYRMMTALTASSKIILTTEVSERHFEELRHIFKQLPILHWSTHITTLLLLSEAVRTCLVSNYISRWSSHLKSIPDFTIRKEALYALWIFPLQ